jgi:hypothetical protein
MLAMAATPDCRQAWQATGQLKNMPDVQDYSQSRRDTISTWSPTHANAPKPKSPTVGTVINSGGAAPTLNPHPRTQGGSHWHLPPRIGPTAPPFLAGSTPVAPSKQQQFGQYGIRTHHGAWLPRHHGARQGPEGCKDGSLKRPYHAIPCHAMHPDAKCSACLHVPAATPQLTVGRKQANYLTAALTAEMGEDPCG